MDPSQPGGEHPSPQPDHSQPDQPKTDQSKVDPSKIDQPKTGAAQHGEPQVGQPWPAPHPAPQQHPYPPQPGPGAPAAPHPAYHGYQQFPGYPAPPPVPPMNGLSIASLVSGIVCCLPPLGLVLGAIALRQIKRKGQRGRGMAIAGTVLSAISCALVAVLLVTGGARKAWDGLQEGVDAAASSQSAMDLKKGDCANLPGGSDSEQEVLYVQVVGCEEPHEAEVTGTVKVTGFDEFPGESRLEAIADERCEKLSRAYAMDPWRTEGRFDEFYYMPTADSWAYGDRGITCAFTRADEGRGTGSVRYDAGRLNADQIAYLTAETKLDGVSDRIPLKGYVKDVAGHRAWARESSAVFAEQARELKGRDWPKSAAGAVADRVKALEKAKGRWDQAVRTEDEGMFWLHALDAEDVLGNGDGEKEIRRALGLTTTPPADEDSESAEGEEAVEGEVGSAV